MAEKEISEIHDEQAEVLSYEEQGAGSGLDKRIKMIGGALLAIVVVAVGVYLYKEYQQEQNTLAMTAISRISQYYESGDVKKALDGDPARKIRSADIMGLKQIVSEYGSTDAGKLAALYAGTALAEEKKYQEASEYFEKAAGSADAVISAGARAGLASCKEFDKQYDEAAKLYEAAAGDKESALYERYTCFAALNYEKAAQSGNETLKEKAKEKYLEIVNKNSGSEFVNEARMGLARLGWHDN
jgi:predicted negative regulator of RcsB-dependent stress response